MKKKLKFIVTPLLVLLAGGGAYMYVFQKPAQQVAIDMNDVVAVSTGVIENRVDVVAKVSLENKESLSFKQSGKVAKVLVKEGQKVQQGQVLATLDMKDYDITLASSKISLDNSKISLQKAMK